MKKTILFFVLLFSAIAFSQTISGIVLDAETQKPIENANLVVMNSELRTSCNQDGRFSVNLNSNEGFTITSIGYDHKAVHFSDLPKDNLSETKIYLKPSRVLLDEVKVLDSNIQNTESKIIKGGKGNLYVFYKNGQELCNLIKNPMKNKKGELEAISFHLHNFNSDDGSAEYDLKFYDYDSIKRAPGNEIFAKKVSVNFKSNESILNVDIDSLQIPFPQNGICIGIEFIKTQCQNCNPKDFDAPSIILSRGQKGSEVFLCEKRRKEVKDWKNKTLGEDKLMAKDNMIFDVVVRFEK